MFGTEDGLVFAPFIDGDTVLLWRGDSVGFSQAAKVSAIISAIESAIIFLGFICLLL
jgi:hypothetical protein